VNFAKNGAKEVTFGFQNPLSMPEILLCQWKSYPESRNAFGLHRIMKVLIGYSCERGKQLSVILINHQHKILRVNDVALFSLKLCYRMTQVAFWVLK